MLSLWKVRARKKGVLALQMRDREKHGGKRIQAIKYSKLCSKYSG